MIKYTQKTVDVIANCIKQAGFDAVHRPVYANTGAICVQHGDSLGDLMTVVYDLQSDTSTFNITVGTVKCLPYPARRDYFDFYYKNNDVAGLAKFISRVKRELETLK